MSYQEARKVVEAFFRAFNAMDGKAIRNTLHFPHVMIAGVNVMVMERPEDFVNPTPRLAETEGWHHSEMNSLEAIQSSDDKVHFVIEFSRHRADGYKYAAYQGIWILTKDAGRWRIQARSILMPERF
jgi:hypothetical protein